MDYSITGKVYKVLPELSGDGQKGRWVKQNFVIETQESYPKKVCFVAWNDRAAIVKNLRLDQEVKVSFAVESREYQDQWFTDIKAVDIEVIGSQAAPQKQAEEPPMIHDPFQTSPSSGFDSFSPSDDLPF
jgi:hypothetical protein